MPELNHVDEQGLGLDQAEEQTEDAAASAKEKGEGALGGLKSKLDRDGDGDTDFDDVKTMAKEAVGKVKGIFGKS